MNFITNTNEMLNKDPKAQAQLKYVCTLCPTKILLMMTQGIAGVHAQE
jgi:hypothetical protein